MGSWFDARDIVRLNPLVVNKGIYSFGSQNDKDVNRTKELSCMTEIKFTMLFTMNGILFSKFDSSMD